MWYGHCCCSHLWQMLSASAYDWKPSIFLFLLSLSYFSLWLWIFALPKLTVQTRDFISTVSYVTQFQAPTELDQTFSCQFRESLMDLTGHKHSSCSNFPWLGGGQSYVTETWLLLAHHFEGVRLFHLRS